MKKNWLVVSTGFALFAMFFGSGNLVFPIAVGQESEGHFLMGSLGILLTGVLVPFLGVFGMMLYNGDLRSFFSCFGKTGTFWFSLFALSLMGPFGVLARCLTVMHGALQLLFNNLSLPMTSFILCAIIFGFTVNKSKIVSVLGNMLTPFLLVAIAVLAFFGLQHGVSSEMLNDGAFKAFTNGFFQGYQTMDLLAAFFFSTFVINYLKKAFHDEPNEGKSINVFLKASLVGGFILSSVYVALVMLGWSYSSVLVNQPPQAMLGMIAMEALGPFAAPVVCALIVLACLTTGIVLTSLFADFLRKEVSKEKLGNKQALLITLAIGFAISTLEFSGIAAFIGPILEATYPALIVLTIVNIAHKLLGVKSSHWPVTLTLAAKLCWV